MQKTHYDYDLLGPPDEQSARQGSYWCWTTPSGITIADEPEPPLG